MQCCQAFVLDTGVCIGHEWGRRGMYCVYSAERAASKDRNAARIVVPIFRTTCKVHQELRSSGLRWIMAVVEVLAKVLSVMLAKGLTEQLLREQARAKEKGKVLARALAHARREHATSADAKILTLTERLVFHAMPYSTNAGLKSPRGNR